MNGSHLDSDRIAAYAERRLSAEERSLLEAHLAECSECRHEASAVALFLRAEHRRRQRWLVGTPLAAAAALALVVLGRRPADTGGPGGGLRPGAGVEREGLGRVDALAPGLGAIVVRDSVRLTWRSVGLDALYSVTVTDTTGRLLWETRTLDTTLTPPRDLELVSGARYHWLVDVLLPSGRTATTGLREFRISR